MKKIQIISGYLIVKYNDREKKEYDGTALGEYGIIDPELYTGSLDCDRGAMEYDDVDSLEEAVELARGLSDDKPGSIPAWSVISKKISDPCATLAYLREQRDCESHNLLCYSANYLMAKPKEGYAEEWNKEVQACRIIDELISFIGSEPSQSRKATRRKEPPNQTTQCGKLKRDILDHISNGVPHTLTIDAGQ